MTRSIITLPEPSVGLTSGDPLLALPGTGQSSPPGVEAILEWRGAYLNNRNVIDTFIIDEIDGLGDADVRDSREVNPTSHGETPFSSLYGGRPIVLTGKIRAHTLWKMRDMQQGLRQLFVDLDNEYPLI